MTLVISNNENYIIINVVFVGELCSPCVQLDNLCSETCFCEAVTANAMTGSLDYE